LVGEIDELAGWIGIARSEISDSSILEMLEAVQSHLSTIMAVISASQSNPQPTFPEIIQDLNSLESWITKFENETNFPHVFIQAGASRNGALLNLIRAISRRVERKAVAVLYSEDEHYSSILTYLNRLSTLFYILWVRVE
jgi:cob(I)alamin adenosyltransferase